MYEHENKRDIHVRSSSAARRAIPRLASSRRAVGCGNEPMFKFLPRTMGIRTVRRELKRFAVVEPEYERCTSSRAACSFRLPPLLHLPPQPVRVLLLCLYKRGRSSPERHTRRSPSSRHKVPEHCAAATIFSIPACGVHRRSGQ